MDEDEALLTRVSYHAVTRYVQRVLGCPQLATYDLDGRDGAAAHCSELGLSIDAVRRLILTPGVRMAMRLNAVSVRSPLFVAKLNRPQGQRQSIVVTIYDQRRNKPLFIRDATKGTSRGERRPVVAPAYREFLEG